MALRGEHLLILIFCLLIAISNVSSARDYPYETNEISVDGIYSSAVVFLASECQKPGLLLPVNCCCIDGVFTCNCR